MEKIVVIGSPGAGKTTFARALGEILGIEVLHLDRYFWQAGWKQYSRMERAAIQQKLIEGKDRWIMEGSYISSSDARLDAADTIIFLDMPPLLCFWQAIKRHIATYKQPFRPDLPDGCTDRLSLLSIAKILLFPYNGRTLLCAKIKQRGENQELYTLCSHRESKYFLHRLPNKRLREEVYTEQEFARRDHNGILTLYSTALAR